MEAGHRAPGSDLVVPAARDTIHWSTGGLGKMSLRTVMISLRHPFRLPWVALLAIVGMLSVVGEAWACPMEAHAGAAHACCARLPASECGCSGPAQEVARPTPGGRAVALPTAAGVGLHAP